MNTTRGIDTMNGIDSMNTVRGYDNANDGNAGYANAAASTFDAPQKRGTRASPSAAPSPYDGW